METNRISEQEARAIAVDAYIYLYPLLSMDITRKQFTNIAPGKEFGKGPMNMFVSVPAYPPADFKGVVRSNFDTLYSIAWLDLSEESLVISTPDTNGRFYLLPMLDMWTDVFASPGWRTTGTQAGNFLVTPPGWVGPVPKGFTRIAAPTPYVWVTGRTKTEGPAEYATVNKIQAGYVVTPLSVNAFWSITLYDAEGFQVANVLNRFAVSSWMPFNTNADGSLDLYFQNKSPGKDKEANWLPAPVGAFNLTMRLYGPKTDALTGKWNPPAVKNML